MARKTKKNRERSTPTDDETNEIIPLREKRPQRLLLLSSVTIVVLAIAMASVVVIPEKSEKLNNSNHPSAWVLDNFQTRQFSVSDTDNEHTTRSLTIEKLSSHPPIFRIPNFLTPNECATLRRLAVEELREGYVDSDQGLSEGSRTSKKKKMLILDANQDGQLSILELLRMVDDYFESHLEEKDIHDMLSHIQLSLDSEGTVSIQDFIQSDTAGMRRYFKELIQESPSKRSRHSKMAWINTRKQRNSEDVQVLEAIRQRVALLTKLPGHVVHDNMELQVVHYENGQEGTTNSGGRYTAHFDSLAPDPEIPCCHIAHRHPPCRPCRMATVLYNLSEKGGATAFPLAGKNMTAESLEEWRSSAASRDSSYCSDNAPGLRIPPQLGQAILWYNHQMDHLATYGDEEEELPLLGPLDRSSLHAGCPSIQKSVSLLSDEVHMHAPGKWIANHWIEASNIAGEDEKHL